MMADEFVAFVHKVQDVISLSSLAFDDEERKSEVDLDWIWKDNKEAAANIPPAIAKPPPVVVANIPPSIVNPPPVVP
jgi:hypothetical protein